MSKGAKRVLITGAAGQIGYSLIPLFCDGKALGEDQDIILHLLDIPQSKGALEGIVMEIHDGAYPLVQDVVPTVDPAIGFANVDVAVLVGGFPRLQGMTRADLLQKNCAIFKEQGECLAKHSSKDCKVLVVANPANTNALIAYQCCQAAGGSIPKENFTCLTRLDMNRASSQIAVKGKVPVRNVKNVTIWGNHSADQYPDVSHATITSEGKTEKVENFMSDHKTWLEEEFISTVQKRGAAVISARGKSSAMSAANAVKDHIHDWLLGTPEGQVVSMGVISDGNPYGVAEGLIYSFPVTCQGGQWKHADGISVSDAGRACLQVNQDKLQEEISMANAK
mmetsp:Transcript_31508/g.61498  ORF Transcript_31508/g.61498 Transcript_31508/m.61498 type:complete len:337 (-) Transcript_31508:344-1354(-)|eukprot:CAMPEP_0175093648 /NCGR_PEP_ID=MMETSP0086_2-20121207/3138_1 /TAXON_ID=136419 /ORGANISM="Unknown Unknown, Strain D1" /LENGTH=336 /DNA_ID=CAMNT_0016366651 /DNA_START=11 /DNA_END=1021 /DNA_ORIENTATION=+